MEPCYARRCLLMVFLGAGSLAGCDARAPGVAAAPRSALLSYTGGEVTGTATEPSADMQAMAQRLTGVLALGYNTVATDVVAKQLMNKDPSVPATSLFVLDVRDPADFAAGHIPGAVNVPLATVPQVLLEQPTLIPVDKDVIVASYFGSDGNLASLTVNVARVADPAAQKAAADAKQPLPYRTSKALYMGMASWTYDLAISPSRFDSDLGVNRVDRPAQTTANAGVDQGAYPAYAAFGPEVDTLTKKLLVRAHHYLAAYGPTRGVQTNGVSLASLLEDGLATNDPQVVDARTATLYAGGHVPAASNIAYQSVANLVYTKLVSPTTPVVVYCVTGHTGALATMALGVLGYPVKNMMYGMNGWNVAVSGSPLSNFDVQKGWDFPLHNWGSGLDTLATYVPPSTGCVGCHTSLTAMAYDTWNNPLPAAAVPLSTGEG